MSTIILVLTLISSSGTTISQVPVTAATEQDALTICDQKGRKWAKALGSASNVATHYTCI